MVWRLVLTSLFAFTYDVDSGNRTSSRVQDRFFHKWSADRDSTRSGLLLKEGAAMARKQLPDSVLNYRCHFCANSAMHALHHKHLLALH